MNGTQVQFSQLTQTGGIAYGGINKQQKSDYMFEGLLKDGTTQNALTRHYTPNSCCVVPKSGGRFYGKAIEIWYTGALYIGESLGYTLNDPYFSIVKQGFGTWISADGETQKTGWWRSDQFEDGKYYAHVEDCGVEGLCGGKKG